MKYKCSLCGKVVSDDLKVLIDHTNQHIIDVIKQDHPDWAEKNGMCQKCFDYYNRQLKGESGK